MLDRDIPDDIEFEVGQPVSVGLRHAQIGSGEPFLREISIVPRGAVKGAEVTSRDVLEPAAADQFTGGGMRLQSRRPPVRLRLPPALSMTSSSECRLSGDRRNFEQANVEASRTPLQKHYAEHVAAKRQREPQVITRSGIGQVLAVGGVPVGELETKRTSCGYRSSGRRGSSDGSSGGRGSGGI